MSRLAQPLHGALGGSALPKALVSHLKPLSARGCDRHSLKSIFQRMIKSAKGLLLGRLALFTWFGIACLFPAFPYISLARSGSLVSPAHHWQRGIIISGLSPEVGRGFTSQDQEFSTHSRQHKSDAVAVSNKHHHPERANLF